MLKKDLEVGERFARKKIQSKNNRRPAASWTPNNRDGQIWEFSKSIKNAAVVTYQETFEARHRHWV